MPRPVLFRRSDDRVLSGVAGGVAARLGVDPVLVRVSVVVLTLAGGVGAALYALGWLLADEPAPDEDPPAPSSASGQQTVAMGLVVVGVLLLLRAMGLWLGDGVVWPAVVAGAGSVIIWTRTDGDGRWARLSGKLPGLGPLDGIAPARLLGGLVLVAAGMSAFLATQNALRALRDVALAMVVTGAGVALLAGPWLLRLVQDLSAERRERIRADERASMAVHLHDSVLQTLALIQRSADDPRRMASLARRQERELRGWLYGVGGRAVPTALAAAVEEIVDDVEDDHGVVVDAVVVGEAPVDGRAEALLRAIREAVVNAAKHAGVGQVSVYVEAHPDHLNAFVRDRGRGFEPAEVGEDRRGIRDSIVGRVEGVDGSASVRSVPGEGTEVELSVPHVRSEDEAPS